VLGALFSSERFKRDETELVILITPYLVKPMRERIAKTPIDRPDLPGPGAAVKPKSTSGLIFK
jgi:pilus assembly protein CpaC